MYSLTYIPKTEYFADKPFDVCNQQPRMSAIIELFLKTRLLCLSIKTSLKRLTVNFNPIAA